MALSGAGSDETNKKKAPPAGKGVGGARQQKGSKLNTSEVLYKAADLIEERGWSSGSGWQDVDGGPLCAEGAVAVAMGRKNGCGVTGPAYHALRKYVGRAPFIWNDSLTHDRIGGMIDRGEILSRDDLAVARVEVAEWAKTEVLSVLRAAAVIEAAKESAPVAELAS